MARKAVTYFINVIFVVLTLIFAVLSVFGFLAGYVKPCESSFILFMGVCMPFLLAIDLVFLVYWMKGTRLWLFAPALALLLNIGFIISIFQITFPKPKGHDIKIATYNVHGFRYAKFNITVENIAQIMRDEKVDVVCLQEFSSGGKSYNMDSIRNAFYNLPYVFAPENMGQKYGVAIFSGFPILATSFTDFPDTENGAMWVDIDLNNQRVRIFNNHFQTTSVSSSRPEMDILRNLGGYDLGEERAAFSTILSRLKENGCMRAAQVEQVKAMVDATDSPVIVCGDFNDTPSSYSYHVMKRGLKDGFRTCGRWYEYTFRGLGNLMRLDMIFHSPDLKGVKYYSVPYEWSDHKPVFMEMVVDYDL